MSRRLMQDLGRVTLAAALLSGCAPLAVKEREIPPICETRFIQDDPPYVGVAISGGGTRAAVFAAYVLDLLTALRVTTKPAGGGQDINFMERVQYMSSVSGGGLAASYYAVMNRDKMHGSAWVGDRDAMAQMDGYHAAMNKDLQTPLIRHAVFFGIRTRAPVEKLDALLNDDYLKGQTFATLSQLEGPALGGASTGPNYHSPKSPRLIFNSTNYDTGRKFVMTNIPTSAFALEIAPLARQLVQKKTGAGGPLNVARVSPPSWFCEEPAPASAYSLIPDGFDAIHGPRTISIEYANMPLSRAVAASAGFPLVGPLSLTVLDKNANVIPGLTYTHLMDGGVTDNSGVESLAQLFLNRLLTPEGRQSHALMVRIDASMPFKAADETLRNTHDPIKIIYADPSRLIDEQEERAKSFRSTLWSLAGGDGEMDDGGTEENPISRTKIVYLRHTDILTVNPDDARGDGNSTARRLHRLAQISMEGKILVKDCQAGLTVKEASNKLAAIGTKLATLSPCETSLLRVSACVAVARAAPDIQLFFRNYGAEGTHRDGRAARPAVDKEAASDVNLAPLLQRIHVLCDEVTGEV